TGRAMRKSDETGKKLGYVMVPLFLDMTASETIDEALHRTDFSDVWDVLSAMKEQDDVLTDIIRQMREDKGRTGGYDESRLRQRVEVLGPSISLEAIRNSVTAECVESFGAIWDERYGELLAYRDGHGNLNIPQRSSTKLGLWSHSQRQNRKNGILTAERIRLLDVIGFEWAPRDSVWDEGFNKLLAYKAAHGNVDVSKHQNTDLGTWVSVQRKAKSRGEITEERVQRLNEVGFIWDAHESRWDELFRLLCAYKQAHGHLNIPTSQTGLGSWVHIQRRAKRNGKLSEEKIQRLDEVGFAWELIDSRWEEKYNELVAYGAKHGNLSVPASSTVLRNWVSKQRTSKREGELSKERVQLLDKIGFDWEPPMSPPPRKNTDADWLLRYKELLDYKAACGDTNVPGLWVTGLGRWASTQRQAKKNDKLSEERTRFLEEIGFEWVLKSGRK
ncbi:MAG: helicase associated domain-containing protein, partial [Fimbriimonadaceae bacterium]